MSQQGLLRDELQKIYDKHKTLTTDLVVKEARKQVSPLHGYFDWNDASAAHEWRKWTAGQLIRRCTIVYKTGKHGEPQTIRAFHAVPSGNGISGPYGEHTYEPSERIAADPALRAIVLAEMERELKSLEKRYGYLDEFFTLLERTAKRTA